MVECPQANSDRSSTPRFTKSRICVDGDAPAGCEGVANLAQTENRNVTHQSMPISALLKNMSYGQNASGASGTAECPGQSGFRKAPSATARAVSTNASSTLNSGLKPSSWVIRDPSTR